MASALIAAIALSLSACTPPPGGPQGAQSPAMAPPPVPVPAPVQEPEAPPPPGPTPEAMVTGGKAKVALILPLSGPNQSVGQAMLDAANLALFDVSADLALLPRETGPSSESARIAAQKAINDGAGLILGPIFAANVPSVRFAAEPANVSVLSYSTDTSVAGGNAFVMGFLPAQQVDRVISFAKSRGLSKIAVFVPDNPYGVAVSVELENVATRLGMPAPRIVQVLGRDPATPFKGLGNDAPDALLVALGGDQLRELGDALAAYKAAHPKVQLLGTGLWDDPSLGQIPALVGGWYAAPLPTGYTEFEEKFEQIYSYKPPRIASLAYDSVALAATIAKSTPGNLKPFTRESLIRPAGFLGIDGVFRFLDSGLSERNLALLEIAPEGPQVIDPPPPTFESVGQ